MSTALTLRGRQWGRVLPALWSRRPVADVWVLAAIVLAIAIAAVSAIGGPALAANGQVIGITVAESARRGRIYTAAPSSILRLLNVEQVAATGAPGERMTPDNYGQESDDLRRNLAVAQVVCVAAQPRT